MLLLAIESAALVASAALLKDDRIIAQYTLCNKMTHSQTLMPMTASVFESVGERISDIDAIAVSSGPGSFTGLRIGAASALGIAGALEVPLIAVPTLDALAYGLCGSADIICPIMDARREQVYNGIYRCRDDLQIVKQSRALALDELISDLDGFDERVVFLGDAIDVYKDDIKQKMKGDYVFAPYHLRMPSAAAVASLGKIYLDRGQICTAENFSLTYIRKSQAERQREAGVVNKGALPLE